LKKFFLAVGLLILLILSVLYLAVNSPYVVDRVARKYAPRFHFSYDRISGNPLKGVVVDGLKYRGRPLASRIAVRINPYTLLEKTLTVSRLHLTEVDVETLERVIVDFASPESSSGEESEKESTAAVLPLAVEVQDIRLSLLPFRRYGVRVEREELSVESIYYDTGRFRVGQLRQVADTSLGTIELEGTYHKRFLDVQLLAVEDLDLGALETLLKALGTLGSESDSGTGNAPSRQTDATDMNEDPFLPRKIRAKRLWITLRPYRIDPYVDLRWTQLEGREVLVDLEHSRLLEGNVTGDLDCDLGRARVRLVAREGNVTLEEGSVGALNLEKILALASGREENGSVAPKMPKKSTRNAEANALSGRIPFLPSRFDVRQLRIELKPGRLEGIDYRNGTVELRNVSADLSRRRLLARRVTAYLDTPLAELGLDLSIDREAIRIGELRLRNVDPEKIRTLAATEREKRSEGSAPVREAEKEDGDDGNVSVPRGVTLPFVPSTVELRRGRLSLRPWRMQSLELAGAELALGGLRGDLRKMVLEEGNVSLNARSNFADLALRGAIRGNRLLLDGNRSLLTLSPELFPHYDLPLRAEAFSPIRIGGEADATNVDLHLCFEARKLLKEENASRFNLDINRSRTLVHYDPEKGTLKVTETALLSMPQEPALRLRAEMERSADGALKYRAAAEAAPLRLGDPRIEKMLGAPKLHLEGDLHRLSARLSAGVLNGSFLSSDLKKGTLKLATSRRLKLAEYLKLPAKLAAAEASFRLDAPIDFSRPLPLSARLALDSNLATAKGELRYDGNLSAAVVVRFPKDSLLRRWDPRLRLNALDPFKLGVVQKKDTWKLTLTAPRLAGAGTYRPETERLEGELNLAGSRIEVKGSPQGSLTATLRSPSLKKMLGGIDAIYRVEMPKLDGDVALTLRLEQLKRGSLELRSRQFVPDATARIKSPVKNIRVLVEGDLKRKSLTIRNYALETAGMKLFAKKSSRIQMKGERIVLEEFWVNDSLKLTGQYDMKRKKGAFSGKASRFKIVHENAKVDTSVDLKGKIDGEKIDLKGKIVIYGGKVFYDIQAKHYATDEDIVILQHRKKNEESFFIKNVQLNLYVETKKPLLFEQKDVRVELTPQLSVLKGFGSELQVMGSVSLAKGGYYIFEGKRFVLRPSSVNFTGKPTRPLLDINLEYRRYSRTIYITVTGVATEPNLHFSSDPYMTRDQILSFILFDTTESGESAGNMLSMVGGGIAKSILGNMGLKVDTLVLTQEGFEVGKKISDRITILYDQKEKDPKVIVRIRNSKRTETDISIGSESQSVDIIYKREF
jgi:translocation and assembly module TamB